MTRTITALSAIIFVFWLAVSLKVLLSSADVSNWPVGLGVAAITGAWIGLVVASRLRPRVVDDDDTDRSAEWSDTPLYDPAEDGLGHALFARMLAESLGSLENV